jgi:hypothetical protein
MKRLRRWIWPATVLISLLLFPATIAVWIRSYWTSDLIAATRFRNWQIEINRGEFGFSADQRYSIQPFVIPNSPQSPFPQIKHVGAPHPISQQWQFSHMESPAYGSNSPTSFLGFDHSYLVEFEVDAVRGSRRMMSSWTQPVTTSTEGAHWYLPAWSIAFLMLLAPAWWMRGWLKYGRDRRRLEMGCCPNCGYDLRATPERCPECGKENLI